MGKIVHFPRGNSYPKIYIPEPKLGNLKNIYSAEAFCFLTPEERMHSRRIAKLAKKLSEELKMNEKECKYMDWAGLYHDIGKTVIKRDLRVLEKELNEQEKRRMELHSLYSYIILKNDPYFGNKEIILLAVIYHHENLDGSGYPHGISGPEIPQGAMVLNVCDDFDAAIDLRRTYNGVVLSVDECKEDMLKKCGKEYDSVFVEVLFKKVLTDEFLKGLNELRVRKNRYSATNSKVFK